VSLRDPTIRDVVGAVATFALAVGVVAAFVPDRLPAGLLGVVADVEATVDAWVVVLVLSLVVFAYALYRFRRADDGTVERLVREDSGQRSEQNLDGAVVDFDPERPGRAFDYAMARTVVELDADPNADAWEADRVRADLGTAVVAVLTGRGQEATVARAAVEDGSWTEDRLAAAFLGGSDAPGVSLRRRAYAWLFPTRAFRRRVERVVDEIEVLARSGEREGAGEARNGAEGSESVAAGEGVES
jgi:hypothetical protein